uniref:Uncharacterized protein n=1 Tax=Magallana gigas TaxID=29159 RepID=K1PR63_MAGGI
MQPIPYLQIVRGDAPLVITDDGWFDRIHLIDCLPNVWMLDGRIITCKYPQHRPPYQYIHIKSVPLMVTAS